VTVNITASGFSNQIVLLFLGPIYAAPSLGSGGLVVGMSAGSANLTTVTVFSEFPNLEQLVSTLWGGAAVFALVGGIAWVGGQSIGRFDRLPWAVAGGVGAGVTPVAMYLLGVPTAFPWLGWLIFIPALFGLLGAMLALGHMTVGSSPELPEWHPPGPRE